MPITLPNLDDREYADLVAEAKALIPQLAPSWTDHNPSDPGITLIELFAYICEMLMYRNDQVTGQNILMFLQLLMGKAWIDNPKRSVKSENQLIQAAIAELRSEERAISNTDFERYALNAGKGEVARAYCKARRNYSDAKEIGEDAVGHVSLVIIPLKSPYGSVSESIIKNIKDDLTPRLLLTTRLHVVPAKFVPLSIDVELKIADDYRQVEVKSAVFIGIDAFFNPINGGKVGRGWKPGQSIYLSDIYALLDRVPGVDYVKSLNVSKKSEDESDSGVSDHHVVRLSENELPVFDMDTCKTEINRITFI